MKKRIFTISVLVVLSIVCFGNIVEAINSTNSMGEIRSAYTNSSNVVRRIAIRTIPNKTTLEKGEKLNLNGGTIAVINGQGYGKALEMTAQGVKISGYGSNKVGLQPITVEYEGKTAKFYVNVKDMNTINTVKLGKNESEEVTVPEKDKTSQLTVEKIYIVLGPNKTEYKQGEQLDLTGGYVTMRKSDGQIYSVRMTDEGVKVTGYDANKIGKQTLTVHYEGKTTTFDVVVRSTEPEIERIYIVLGPNKTEYKQGEQLDLTGGYVTVKEKDTENRKGQIYSKYLTNEDVKVTGYDANKVGKQTLTVHYKGFTTTFDVNVIGEPEIEKIYIVKGPNKLEYKQGEPLNLIGGYVTMRKSDQQIYSVNMTDKDVKVTGYDANKIGKQTLTVHYKGFTTTFDVNVVGEPEIEEIYIVVGPNKTEYKQGEQLDLTGGYVTMRKSDGQIYSVTMMNKDVKITGYNANKVGKQTLTVHYKGFTTTFDVNVVGEPTIEKIYIVVGPNKTEYKQGEKLDLTGGYVTMRKSDQQIYSVNMTNKDVQVTGYNANKVGRQTLTVHYKGFTTTFDVNVIASSKKAIKSVTVLRKPNKINYYTEDCQPIDYTGGYIMATYTDGTKKSIPMTSNEVGKSGYDYTKLGWQDVELIYEGKATSFKVCVTKRGNAEQFADIIQIKVTRMPTKTEYKQGEKLDLTGGCIQANYNNNVGVAFSMKNSDVKVSGYDANKVGQQTVMLTYKGKTTTFKVTVKEPGPDEFNSKFMKYRSKTIKGSEVKTVVKQIINNNANLNNRKITVRYDFKNSDKSYTGTAIPTASIKNNSKYVVNFGYNYAGYITMIIFSEI